MGAERLDAGGAAVTAYDRWLTDDDPYRGEDIVDVPDEAWCPVCGGGRDEACTIYCEPKEARRG